jgi:hypothetical protein
VGMRSSHCEPCSCIIQSVCLRFTAGSSSFRLREPVGFRPREIDLAGARRPADGTGSCPSGLWNRRGDASCRSRGGLMGRRWLTGKRPVLSRGLGVPRFRRGGRNGLWIRHLQRYRREPLVIMDRGGWSELFCGIGWVGCLSGSVWGVCLDAKVRKSGGDSNRRFRGLECSVGCWATFWP